jgi:hypothetical protein
VSIPIRDVLPLVISVASLLLSAYAIWVTQFNHGRLKMTRPSLLCLKREFPGARPKIFLRSCLFTTGTKGRVIEQMFLNVRNGQGAFVFDFWGHTEQGKLTLGSGLFVGSTGVVSDHHFNPREGTYDDFLYVDGEYTLDVFATIAGQRKARKLLTMTFSVGSEQAAEVIQIPTREMYLLWNADSQRYDVHVRHDNKPLEHDALASALANLFAYQPSGPNGS